MLECMTQVYIPEWKLVRRWSHIFKSWSSILTHIYYTYCQKNIKTFTFIVQSCRTPAVLLFYYKSTNKSLLSRILFKADFSRNADNFHQEKILFLSYDRSVIFSWCLCSFLSLGFFFFFYCKLNIVTFWKGTTPSKGVLLTIAYSVSWW